MTILSDSVFIESKSARDNQLAQMPHERAASILNKVKALYFALWQGTGAATTEQMREFYEVKIDAVEAALRRCRSEARSRRTKNSKRQTAKEFQACLRFGSGDIKSPQLNHLDTSRRFETGDDPG